MDGAGRRALSPGGHANKSLSLNTKMNKLIKDDFTTKVPRLPGRVLWAMVLATFIGPPSASTQAQTSGNAATKLRVVPWPRSLEGRPGGLTLGPDARIVVPAASLVPLSQVLAAEVEALFHRKLSCVETAATRPGDILLEIEPGLKKEEYRLEVTDRVQIAGGSYAATAAGTASLLQALTLQGAALVLPAMTIDDAPQAAYRGLMVDVARYWHSVKTLQQCVLLCRWYKLNYLQLHLTDDQSFTFPSRAFPKLATPGRHYTLEQLRDLERYAADRGVVIVPELDVPGHSGTAIQAMPEVFATKHGDHSTMNFVRPEACRAVDTLIGELLEVFGSTPYFHLGADECNIDGLKREPEFQEAMKKLGVTDVQELYRDFLVERNRAVKRLGKRMIVWEGFSRGGKVDVPRDILVMVFESSYYRPDWLVQDGYTAINASWQPLYVVTCPSIGGWTPAHIFTWNMYRWEHWQYFRPSFNPIQLKPDAPVLGAQMCSWQQPENFEIESLRLRLASMSERVWNPAAGRNFADFSQRLESTDAAFSRLLQDR
jgi:hexosaminidase